MKKFKKEDCDEYKPFVNELVGCKNPGVEYTPNDCSSAKPFFISKEDGCREMRKEDCSDESAFCPPSENGKRLAVKWLDDGWNPKDAVSGYGGARTPEQAAALIQMNIDNGYYDQNFDPCMSGTWQRPDPNATRRRFVETPGLTSGFCRPLTQQDCDKIMSCVSENGDIVLGENEESCASKNNTWQEGGCSDPDFNDSEESCKKGRLIWYKQKNTGFCYDGDEYQKSIRIKRDCKSKNTWSWSGGGSCSDDTFTTEETCVAGTFRWVPSDGECLDVPANGLLSRATTLDKIRTEAECKTNNTWTGGCSDSSKNASKSACFANNRTWKNTPMVLRDGKCTSPEVARASLHQKRDQCDRFWDHTTNTCRDFVPEDCGKPVTTDHVQSPLYYQTTRGHAKACRNYEEKDCNDGYIRDIVMKNRRATCYTDECRNPTFNFVSNWSGCDAHTPHKPCNRSKFISGKVGCRPYTEADCTVGRPVFVSETEGCRSTETKESCKNKVSIFFETLPPTPAKRSTT